MSRIPSQPFEAVPDGVRLHILVQPRAPVTAVVGVHDDRIKVRLAAPPVDGAANEALVRFLAKTLGVPQAGLEIIAGETSRRKTVFVENISLEQARDRLLGGSR